MWKLFLIKMLILGDFLSISWTSAQKNSLLSFPQVQSWEKFLCKKVHIQALHSPSRALVTASIDFLGQLPPFFLPCPLHYASVASASCARVGVISDLVLIWIFGNKKLIETWPCMRPRCNLVLPWHLQKKSLTHIARCMEEGWEVVQPLMSQTRWGTLGRWEFVFHHFHKFWIKLWKSNVGFCGNELCFMAS